MTVESYFRQRAAKFDALYEEARGWRGWINRRLRRGLFERVERTLDALEGLRDFTVLDVGCGSGRNSVLFAQVGARRVLGIDFSEPMIALARQLTRRHGVDDRCQFILGDFMAHSFAERFDVVVALGVFEYVADPPPMLRRMMELSSGRVIASFPERSLVRAPLRKFRYALRHCPVYFYTRGRLEEICRQAGLTDYRIVPYASSGLLLVGEMGAAKR